MPAFTAILRTCQRVFDTLTPGVPAWEVEVHQFRIEAQPGQAGQPTPEGMHRDGVDWVLVLLVRRENIASGETTIHDLERGMLGSFTLARPMDAAWVDDGRVYHGVTPVEPRDPAAPPSATCWWSPSAASEAVRGTAAPVRPQGSAPRTPGRPSLPAPRRVSRLRATTNGGKP